MTTRTMCDFCGTDIDFYRSHIKLYVMRAMFAPTADLCSYACAEKYCAAKQRSV